jgi:hypothetical protein
VCLIINWLRATLSSPSLDLIVAMILFLVLVIRFAPIRLSVSRFFMSSTMSASYMFFVFFIALLIDVPTDIRGDYRGLNCSDKSNDTDVLGDLSGVLIAS